MEEGALEELAVEEILKDLKRGAERAKEHGALGWQKNPAPPPNKRFLRNMLVSTLRDDRPQSKKGKFHNNRLESKSNTSVTVASEESAKSDPFFQDHRHSETTNDDHYFRYNDRYKNNAHTNSDKQQSGSSYKEDLPLHLHQQCQFSEDSQPKQNISTEDGSSISLTDSRLDPHECKALSAKRLYSTSPDSDGEKKSEVTRPKEKRHRKNRESSRKDSEDQSMKKKHKKSKKSKRSKKHKVKKHHRTKKDF